MCLAPGALNNSHHIPVLKDNVKALAEETARNDLGTGSSGMSSKFGRKYASFFSKVQGCDFSDSEEGKERERERKKNNVIK